MNWESKSFNAFAHSTTTILGMKRVLNDEIWIVLCNGMHNIALREISMESSKFYCVVNKNDYFMASLVPSVSVYVYMRVSNAFIRFRSLFAHLK